MGNRSWGAAAAMAMGVVVVACSGTPDVSPFTSSPTSTTTSTSAASTDAGPAEPIEPASTTCPTTAPWLPTVEPVTTTTDPDQPTATAPDPVDNRAPLVAVDATTGAVRLHVCPGPWAFSDAIVVDGVVVVRGRAFDLADGISMPCGVPRDPVVLALSAIHGSVVWASDDRLAWAYYDDPPVPDATSGSVVVQDGDVVRAFDVGSGEQLWEAAGSSLGVGDPVFVVEDGVASGRDRRTGTVLPDAVEPVPEVRRRHVGDQPSATGEDGSTVQVADGEIGATGADGTTTWAVEAPPWVVEVRAVTEDLVIVAGATRIGNCA